MKLKTVLFILIAVLALGAVGVGMYHTLPYHYEQGEEYQAGDASYAATAVQALHIDWINGSITLERYDGDTVTLSETGAPEDTAQQVHSALRDGVLDVRYCQSGALSTGARKQLILRLPKTLIPDLTLTAKTANLVVSGGSYGEVNVENATGLTRFYRAKVDRIIGKTDSGDVNFSGEMHAGKFETVSGNHNLNYTLQPAELAFYSLDGELQLTLPKGAAFTAEFYTKSGSLTSGFKGNVTDNLLTVGKTPTAKYTIVTAGGNLRIDPAK